MPTVSAGSSAVIDVAIGQKIAVSTPGEAYVDIVSGALGAGYTSKRLAGNILSQTFGPYGMETQLNIRAIDGAANYGEAADAASGGGASAFTQLADAPTTITPNAIVIGNSAGDGLAFQGQITANSQGLAVIGTNPDPNGDGATIVAKGGANISSAYLFGGDYEDEGYANVSADCAGSRSRMNVDTTLAEVYANHGLGGAKIIADGTNVYLEAQYRGGLGGPKLKLGVDDTHAFFTLMNGAVMTMTGFDVPASDASAHMTVGGVEYGIAKAVKVKVGSDTFFWPLFGPV